MKKPNLKAARVLNLLNTTTYSARRIAKEVGCTAAYVWKLKKEMAHKEEPLVSDAVPFNTAEAHVRKIRASLANEIQEGGDHYKRLGVEPWDVFDTWPMEQRIGAYRANCTKYIMRLDEKDTPLLNAKKLAHYAQKLVEVLGEANRG